MAARQELHSGLSEMATQTQNYKLHKFELKDTPADITAINASMDIIDTQLKALADGKFDKTGGTISGNLVVNGSTTLKKLTASELDLNGNADVSGTLKVAGATTLTGKLTANGGVTTKALTATNLDLNGNGDVSGSLTVHGDLNAQGGLNVTDITATGATTLVNLNAANITATGTLKVNGATTLTGLLTANGGVTTKKVTATELDLNGNGDVSGNLNVGGLLQVTGSATVGGKTVVLSVNGVQSDDSGNVKLGDDVFQYKQITSIQSVKSSFWFDNNSGIDTSELPSDVVSTDWMGIQIGTVAGNDKTQLLFNASYMYKRHSDSTFGNETWSDWDQVQFVGTGSQTFNGEKTFSNTINIKTGTALGATDTETLIRCNVKNAAGKSIYLAIVSTTGNSRAEDNFNAALTYGSSQGTTSIGAGESTHNFLKAQGLGDDDNLYLTSDDEIRFWTGLNNDGTGGSQVLRVASNGNMYSIGQLILDRENHSSCILLRDTTLTKGTLPSSTKYFDIAFTEKNGSATKNRFGALTVGVTDDGSMQSRLVSYKNEANSTAGAYLGVGYDASGNETTYAPAPVTESHFLEQKKPLTKIPPARHEAPALGTRATALHLLEKAYVHGKSRLRPALSAQPEK